MKKLLLTYISLILFGFLCSQEHFYEFPSKGTIHIGKVINDYNASVFHMESPVPGSNSYRDHLHKLKESIPSKKFNKKSSSDKAEIPPEILKSYIANDFDGIPNDNDIAVSNAGMVVSVTNSIMNIYGDADTLIKSVSLSAFSDSLGLAANSFDPKIAYDPMEDKFILVYLCGNDVSATNIVVAFSQTNNPSGEWNLFALSGNPLNNNTWSDYPIIALTEDELFVTINLIHNDSTSWQTGFFESVIWQIDKNDGYANNSLSTKLYSGIHYDGKPIRNLCPIQGGSGLFGPEMYLISNRNFSLESDTIFVIRVTGLMLNATAETYLSIASNSYGLSPNASQPGVPVLQTNDSRVLGGFIEDCEIHFTGNSRDLSTNLPGVFHGIININNLETTELAIISDNSLEYGYPNMSYTGSFQGDHQSIISFNHSSVDSFAGVSAVFYSSENGYSDRLHISSGESIVNIINGNNERWGDYSGNQLKYNEPGTIYVSGLRSARKLLNLIGIPIVYNVHETTIAVLKSPFNNDSSATVSSCNIISSINNNDHDLDYAIVYPNPIDDIFFVEFENGQAQSLSFTLIDNSGKVIKELLTSRIKKGKNVFKFSLNALSKGIYFLNVKDSSGNTVISNRVIK